MKTLTPLALAAAALALAGCANKAAPDNRADGPANRVAERSPPPPEQTRPQEVAYGPEAPIEGVWTNRFERSELGECWFELSEAAAADLRRLSPSDSTAGNSYRLRFIGRRSHFVQGAPNVFGHMGGWHCQILATRILSAERIGGDRLPASVVAEISHFDAEVESARKAAGQLPPAFGAGHDQARLEDQRRTMPPGAR